MSGIGATIVVEPVWKLLTWIAPAWLYIHHFVEGKNPLVYLKLKRPWQGLAWGIFGCLFVAAFELGNILRSHTFQFQSVDTWVNAILLVGMMEEIPFRPRDAQRDDTMSSREERLQRTGGVLLVKP